MIQLLRNVKERRSSESGFAVQLNVECVPCHMFQVTFELVDLNDNAPQFATNHTRISVSEGSLPGASFSLQPARDIDSPANGVVGYRLVDKTAGCDEAPFDLVIERSADGSHDVRLTLQSPGVDREACDHYTLVVFADDAGSPPRSASLHVDVVVTDINDHRPVWQRVNYDTEISENVDPATYGPSLVTVRATDADDGLNGLVRYRLSSRSHAQFGHLFAVDSLTGRVTLLRPVDYEALSRGGVVVLDVLARDGSDSDSLTTATVRVRVRDVNDNPPEITVQSPTGDQDVFHVPENCVNGTLVARVTVSDADTGDAGQVDCRLRHHNGVRTATACLHLCVLRHHVTLGYFTVTLRSLQNTEFSSLLTRRTLLLRDIFLRLIWSSSSYTTPVCPSSRQITYTSNR